MARIEHDFLGDKEIPLDAYYGVQASRARENFPITGIKPHPELYRAMAIVKKAAALSNNEVGLLPDDKCKAIVAAAEELMELKYYDEHFIVDSIQGGAGTSINMNVNEIIANRAIEILGGTKGDYKLISPNSHVNMAQSTNDSFPTGIHISAITLAKRLDVVIGELIDALYKKGEEFDGVIKMGRTHLQDAVPVRLGQEFRAWAHVLERDRTRLNQSMEFLYEVNMGATAVGTGLNALPEYIEKVVKHLCEITGYELKSAEDLIDGTQNTDAYTSVSGALKILAVNISKICNDLRMMASGPRCGLGELHLPARQPGSSIMPGKVNPVMAEVVNQTAFQVIGNDVTISLASEAGQFELNVMEPVMAFNLLQSLDIMGNALTVFRTHLIEGVTANVERCASYVENSVGVITAINPHVGYETAAATAKEAILSGRPVREIILERGVLTEAELNEILDPMEMTQPGIAAAHLIFEKKNK